MSANPPWLDGLRRPRVTNRFRDPLEEGRQLRLPRLAHWLESRRSPKLQLEHLQDDVTEFKADDPTGPRPSRVKACDPRRRIIDYAMAYADDMLSDAVYAVETALEREIEDQDPARSMPT